MTTEPATPTDHILRTGRTNLGRRTIAGASGSLYGATGRCSCGNWKTQINTAPSKGGTRKVEAAFATHLADVNG